MFYYLFAETQDGRRLNFDASPPGLGDIITNQPHRVRHLYLLSFFTKYN